MLGPQTVNVKRRATEDPPDVLVFAKRTTTVADVKYIRLRKDAGFVKQGDRQQPEEQPPITPTEKSKPTADRVKRFFQLNRIPSVTGKRKGAEAGIATFVEKRIKSSDHAAQDAEDEPEFESTPPAVPLKRPSRRAAVKSTNRAMPQAESPTDRRRMEALAKSMHQAALKEINGNQHLLDDVRQESKPNAVASPKLSAQRSKELHQQRIASNGTMPADGDVDMEGDSDYVYDTYVLAQTHDLGATAEAQAKAGSDNVGYLVVAEEDEAQWQLYLGDDPSDNEANSDEEDENAEDFYGADYPDDELESEDEFDRNVYGFRGHNASDNEEWDEDTGAYSDDEYDRMMSPFTNKTTTTQFAEYLEIGDDDIV